MEIFLTLVYLLLFLNLINKWKFFNNKWISKRKIKIFFILKLIVGLLLFWIYSNHYSNLNYSRQDADIFKYFDDSEFIYNSLPEKPLDFTKIILGMDFDKDYFSSEYYINMNNWDNHYNSHLFNDARAIIRVNSILRIFSFGYYSIHILFFCFIGFIGLFALFKTCVIYFPKKEKWLFYSLFLTPTVLLWSSGVLKEPLMLYAIGFIFYYTSIKSFKKNTFFSLINLTLCLLILFFLKFYVFSILITLLIPFKLNLTKSFKNKLIPYFISLVFFSTIAIFTGFINPKFNLLELIDKKQDSFISETKYKNSGSYFEITNVEPNVKSIIKVIPEAIVNSFTRPWLWNVNSIIQLPAVLENILFLTLIFLASIDLYRKRIQVKIEVNFIIFCLSFVLLNFIIIGAITPVSGALVRYKMIALPFLVMFILHTINLDKFNFQKK